MLEKFDKPLPKRLKRAMLAFKAFIGTIAISTYVADKPEWSFYLLVAGAFIDFLVDSLYGEEK